MDAILVCCWHWLVCRRRLSRATGSLCARLARKGVTSILRLDTTGRDCSQRLHDSCVDSTDDPPPRLDTCADHANRLRRDGRPANGTLTFRRSSTTPIGQSSQAPPPADNAVQPSSVEPATAHPASFENGPSRYSKEHLLEMYRAAHPSDDPSRLFISGWDPDHVNGNTARPWGKTNENHVPQEPGACWEPNGDTMPMGLQEPSAEEKEVRSDNSHHSDAGSNNFPELLHRHQLPT